MRIETVHGADTQGADTQGADVHGADMAEPCGPGWTPPSWEEVVREHSSRVYRLAYRLTGNSHDAEDLTQEVFVRVFRSLSTYTPGTFEGWLHRITTNLFLDITRRKQRIRFEGLGEDAAAKLCGAEPTPSQAFDDRHLDSDIAAALADLPPEYRAAVVLCDIEGLTYEEIADVLGVKLGTVRSRIHRGRAQLRAALEHRRPRHAGQREAATPGTDQMSIAGADAAARTGRPELVAARSAGLPHAVVADRTGLAMTHLGRWLSALVDGELDAAERDHVLNHVAGCEACRKEANALRALKRRMTALGDTSADSAVVRRLIDLGRTDPLAVGGGQFAAWGSAAGLAASARQPSTGRGRASWFGWKIATGSAGATLLAIGVVAFMLGAPTASPRPQVTPALDVYWTEHVHDMGQAPTKPGMPAQIGSVGSGPGMIVPSKPTLAKPSAIKQPTKAVATRPRAAKKRTVRRRAIAPGQLAFRRP